MLHARFCLWQNEIWSCIILQLASGKHATTLWNLQKCCRLKQETWFQQHCDWGIFFMCQDVCRQFAEKMILTFRPVCTVMWEQQVSSIHLFLFFFLSLYSSVSMSLDGNLRVSNGFSIKNKKIWTEIYNSSSPTFLKDRFTFTQSQEHNLKQLDDVNKEYLASQKHRRLRDECTVTINFQKMLP